jgi:hypothetical protein
MMLFNTVTCDTTISNGFDVNSCQPGKTDREMGVTHANCFYASRDHDKDEAGFTKSTLFYHFKTKHDLAVSLIERYAEDDRNHYCGAISADIMVKIKEMMHF